MFTNVFIKRDDALELLKQHTDTLTNRQLEDVLSAIFYDQRVNFRMVDMYRNAEQEREHKSLILSAI